MSDDVFETPKSTNGHSRENSFNDAQERLKFNLGDSSPEPEYAWSDTINYDPVAKWCI